MDLTEIWVAAISATAVVAAAIITARAALSRKSQSSGGGGTTIIHEINYFYAEPGGGEPMSSERHTNNTGQARQQAIESGSIPLEPRDGLTRSRDGRLAADGGRVADFQTGEPGASGDPLGDGRFERRPIDIDEVRDMESLLRAQTRSNERESDPSDVLLQNPEPCSPFDELHGKDVDARLLHELRHGEAAEPGDRFKYVERRES